MSADLCTVLEIRTRKGWTLPTRGFYRDTGVGDVIDLHYAAMHLLAGYEYRTDAGVLPEPIVDTPRGRPLDSSKELYEMTAEYCDPISWLTVEELLLHDWEPALDHPNGPAKWLLPMLDVLFRLGAPRDHRLVLWLAW